MSKPSIEVTKIHMGSEITKVHYNLNGKAMMASDDHNAESFDKAMNALVPHCIAIKELPKNAGEGYRCNALSLTNKPSEQGDNRSVVISITKMTAAGKADNMSTSQHLYEAAKSGVEVLPAKTTQAIKTAVIEARKFITGHRDLTELYSQPELAAAV